MRQSGFGLFDVLEDDLPGDIGTLDLEGELVTVDDVLGFGGPEITSPDFAIVDVNSFKLKLVGALVNTVTFDAMSIGQSPRTWHL